jgi:hypothetical protein
MKRLTLTLIWAFTLLGINADIADSLSGSHNMSGKARAALTALQAEDDEESSEGEGSDNESESDSDQKESDRESEGEGNATD